MCPSSACSKAQIVSLILFSVYILELKTGLLLAEFGALKAFANIFLGCFSRDPVSNTVLNWDL